MQIKKGFTLIEILVVIIIIMLVYSLLVVNFHINSGDKSEKVNLINFKKYLINSYPHYKIDFICLEECKRCFVKVGSKFEDFYFTLDRDIEVYTFDITSTRVKKEFGKMGDDEICFQYTILPDKTSEPVIIKNFNKYYYIPSFFGEVKVFDDFSEAKEWYFKESYPLGDIY